MSELLDAMYLECVKVGIPADKYWHLSFGELMVELEAVQWRRENEQKTSASEDIRLAQLISYAFNDPKNMPQLDDLISIQNQNEEETFDKDELNLLNFFNHLQIEEEVGINEREN
jgi:hypothetical protein